MLIAPAMCVGLVLRVDFGGQVGLNQFDEGIYAAAAGWAFHRGGLAAIDPGLIPYAPPGFPILVGLWSFLNIPADQAAFLVSALAGTLTIAAVAVIARSIFGDRAAVASAWCACCSGPHIAFSRSGMTDASFLLVWSLGLIAGLRFLDRPDWRSATTMGLVVGLAQQFKYNGWLLGGLILGSTASYALWPSLAQLRLVARRIGWGLLGAIVAAVVVLPWYRFVETHGGYAGLLAHQRSYLGGWSTWWPHLRDQADQAVVLAGPTWLALLGAVAIGGSLARIAPGRPSRIDRASIVTFLLAGTTSLTLAAAPATTVLLHLCLDWRAGDVGRRLVNVGGAVLFVLTPFYHPYARLWLPFEMIHWLALGHIIARIVGSAALPGGDRLGLGLRGRAMLSAGLALVCLAWGPGFPLAAPGPIGHAGLFAPSDSLRRVAVDVARRVPPGAAEVRTLIRPALSYYLGARIPIRPQPSLEALLQGPGPGSWALVDSTILGGGQGGAMPLGSGSAGRTLDAAWDLVARFDAVNSLITTLDLDPSVGTGLGGCSVARFWLLRSRAEGHPE